MEVEAVDRAGRWLPEYEVFDAADQALYTAFLKFNADMAWWQARDERPWTCRKHHAVAPCPSDVPPLCELSITVVLLLARARKRNERA